MKKILVIEDELSVRENLVELLEAEDFDVSCTENGFIGALWAQEHLPDLIICDVMMPKVNGYQVLNALRQESMTESIPFIFLTAMADKADMRHGMELGADDYLTKPFTRAELLGAIASRLAKQEIVMKQYKAEHRRVQALQQKLQEMQDYSTSEQKIFHQLQEELQDALPKLHIVMNMLKQLKPGSQREQGLKIWQQTCPEEIALLKKIPKLQELLAPENSDLLSQLIK